MELGESKIVNLKTLMNAANSVCALSAISELEPFDLPEKVTVYRGKEDDGEVFMRFVAGNGKTAIPGMLRFSSDGYIYEGVAGKSVVHKDYNTCEGFMTTVIGAIFGSNEAFGYGIQDGFEPEFYLRLGDALLKLGCFAASTECTDDNILKAEEKITTDLMPKYFGIYETERKQALEKAEQIIALAEKHEAEVGKEITNKLLEIYNDLRQYTEIIPSTFEARGGYESYFGLNYLENCRDEAVRMLNEMIDVARKPLRKYADEIGGF